jgi:hypothetical protein
MVICAPAGWSPTEFLNSFMIQACKAVSTGPEFTIWWLNGPEYFQLWSYDPATNGYAESLPGLLAGRATVVAGPTTVFSIQGTPSLQGGSDGSVQAASVSEYGGTGGNGQPQLQFFAGTARVATVSAGQLKVKGIAEGTPAPGNLFQIFANGTLAGTISAAGQLVAAELEETTL